MHTLIKEAAMQKNEEFLIDRKKGFLIQDRDIISEKEKKEISPECEEFMNKRANSMAGEILDGVLREGHSGICKINDDK